MDAILDYFIYLGISNIFALLKKTASILILAFFVLSGTEVHQLLKLPVLMHHFKEHKKKDNSISFIVFLKMHYDENSDHHSKDHRHEKLPFKNHCCGINHTVVAEIHFFATSLSIDMISLKQESIKYDEAFHSSSLKSYIWQPPKAV